MNLYESLCKYLKPKYGILSSIAYISSIISLDPKDSMRQKEQIATMIRSILPDSTTVVNYFGSASQAKDALIFIGTDGRLELVSVTVNNIIQSSYDYIDFKCLISAMQKVSA